MNDNDNALNYQEVLRLEYEQACNDWRHRDSMLWSTVGSFMILFGSAVAGLQAFTIFKAERTWIAIIIIASFSSSALFVIILQAIKNKYYQDATAEYIKVLLCEIAGHDFNSYEDFVGFCCKKQEGYQLLNFEERGRCPRIIRLNEARTNWINRLSAFKYLIRLQCLILGFSVFGFFVALINLLSYI